MLAGSAGARNPKRRREEASAADIIANAVDNYAQFPILIVEGVPFHQLELLKTEHRYLNSEFEGKSTATDPLERVALDENGDDLYFHNIIVPRNAHATKNIDIDRKDIAVSSDTPDGWFFSFFLRNEIQQWMQDTGFGKLLNDLATNLPNFGKVIWKRTGSGDDLRIEEVDLRDVVFDPSAKTIADSALFIERSTSMPPWKIMQKCGNREDGGWNEGACREIIAQAQAKHDTFIRKSGADTTQLTQFSLSDTMPNPDIWECYGWFSQEILDELKGVEEKKGESTDDCEYYYLKIVVGGLESKAPNVLFWEECDWETDFPYKEFNWFRRVPGRCLPQSNTEVLIGLQIRINELINRFFTALRMGSLQVYQTRKNTVQRNLLTDMQNGDIIVTKDPLEPIQTEVRAFGQYETELNNIERQADLLCNTTDIITGENMPTNTPFRLAAQLGVSAAKIFDQVREDIGLVLSEVFYEWVLPEIIEDLTLEHVLEVTGSVDEMKMFDEQFRKFQAAQSLKKYILQTNRLPTAEQMGVLESAISDDMKNRSRKVMIEDGFFTMEKCRSLRIYFDVSDERRNLVAERETKSTLLQIIAANPAVLESEEARMLLGGIMESSGISPMVLASFASKPTPKAPNPAMAAPAENQSPASAQRTPAEAATSTV